MTKIPFGSFELLRLRLPQLWRCALCHKVRMHKVVAMEVTAAATAAVIAVASVSGSVAGTAVMVAMAAVLTSVIPAIGLRIIRDPSGTTRLISITTLVVMYLMVIIWIMYRATRVCIERDTGIAN